MDEVRERLQSLGLPVQAKPACDAAGMDAARWREPVILEGRRVRLEPLDQGHAGDLASAAHDPEIWSWLPAAQPASEVELRTLIAEALEEQKDGGRIPFAIIDLRTLTAVGSSSYLDIEPEHRRLEIGWTWLGRESWGTGINEESKLLLLTHAFDVLGALRVGLKTDIRNERSQRAIEKIGGTREGVLRKHRVRPDGTSRDSVFFSILDDEWPAVRDRLEAAVERAGLEE